MSLEESVAKDTAELLLEAAEARQLAQATKDGRTIADLLERAKRLEGAAARWERRLRRWRQLGLATVSER